ncbi:hypothetical protein DZC31_08050 [Stenotrophomonas rhizophila]|nr:hypothetical protein DZC31_08050 [Stenotrophomonas rhizophila]
MALMPLHLFPVMHKGGSCWRHRSDWPETNVGAGLPAMRRAGGARSTPQHSPQAIHSQPIPHPRHGYCYTAGNTPFL